jgi:hypothetical protein
MDINELTYNTINKIWRNNKNVLNLARYACVDRKNKVYDWGLLFILRVYIIDIDIRSNIQSKDATDIVWCLLYNAVGKFTQKITPRDMYAVFTPDNDIINIYSNQRAGIQHNKPIILTQYIILNDLHTVLNDIPIKNLTDADMNYSLICIKNYNEFIKSDIIYSDIAILRPGIQLCISTDTVICGYDKYNHCNFNIDCYNLYIDGQ